MSAVNEVKGAALGIPLFPTFGVCAAVWVVSRLEAAAGTSSFLWGWFTTIRGIEVRLADRLVFQMLLLV